MTELHAAMLLSALMFGLGLAAIFGRTHSILVLIGIEFMLDAANINFVDFWRYLYPNSMDGLLFALFSIAVAAAEAGVGLALVICIYRHFQAARVDKIDHMKG